MAESSAKQLDKERVKAMRAAVSERLAEVEKQIPQAIDDVRNLLAQKHSVENAGKVFQESQKLESKTKTRDALVAEHAVLEGLLDRYATRLRANVALAIAAGSIILAVINFIRQS